MTFSTEAFRHLNIDLRKVEKMASAVTVFGIAGMLATMAIDSAFRENAQRAQFIADRSDQIRAQLLGNVRNPNLRERIYERVAVTASARTLAEKIKLEQEGTFLANVRNFPGTRLPNGLATDVVGKIRVGTRVNDVVWTTGPGTDPRVQTEWGAFDCDNAVIEWDLKWIEWNSGSEDTQSGRICAINGDNLQAVKLSK